MKIKIKSLKHQKPYFRYMKSASVQEIRQELSTLKPKEILEICLRLSRFKKENKELLTYLLFEANDEAGYINAVKLEMEELFTTINLSHMYFAKKTLRKILRVIKKHGRYVNSKQADVEWLIQFCSLVKKYEIPYDRHPVLKKIYQQQLEKIEEGISKLHEDLQFDYRKSVEALEND